MIQGSNPGWSVKFIFSSKRPDRLWDPLSLLLDSSQALFYREKSSWVVILTSSLYLLLRLRMSGGIPPLIYAFTVYIGITLPFPLPLIPVGPLHHPEPKDAPFCGKRETHSFGSHALSIKAVTLQINTLEGHQLTAIFFLRVRVTNNCSDNCSIWSGESSHATPRHDTTRHDTTHEYFTRFIPAQSLV
jgi:hypothetical protein